MSMATMLAALDKVSAKAKVRKETFSPFTMRIGQAVRGPLTIAPETNDVAGCTRVSTKLPPRAFMKRSLTETAAPNAGAADTPARGRAPTSRANPPAASDQDLAMSSLQTGLRGTNSERAGDHNQRVTLHAIRINGPVTRPELGGFTGLTLPAIANIIRRLLDEGLILEAGRDKGVRGQPARRLVINLDACFAVGLNVDRDHLNMVLLDFAGVVRARCAVETQFPLPADVRSFYQCSLRTMLKLSVIKPEDIAGVGVAFPDSIDSVRLAGQPDSYADWGDVRLAELLSKPSYVPILVENDAAAAALGEMQFGAVQRFRSFFYILLTAGLGGSLIVDGQHFRGAHGRSGEIGWLRDLRSIDGPRPIQDFVSFSDLREVLARQDMKLHLPHDLIGPEATAAVNRLLHDAAERLTEPLLSLNFLINPEAVLIGGRLPAAIVDLLAARLNASMDAHRKHVPWMSPILRAQMSDDAAAVGAGILAHNAELLLSGMPLLKQPH